MDSAKLGAYVRWGLMACNALSLCVIAAAAAIYVTRPDDVPQAPATRVASVRPAVPPLPRIRPDEPIITGSIVPAAAPLPPQPSAALAPLEIPALRRMGDLEAILACEDKVRTGLPLPGSLSRDYASTGVLRAPDDDPVVTFAFNALNGLGFPQSLRVQCVFDHDRIARLEVNDRAFGWPLPSLR